MKSQGKSKNDETEQSNSKENPSIESLLKELVNQEKEKLSDMKKDYVEKVFLVADIFKKRKRMEDEYKELCAKRGKWIEKNKYYVKTPEDETVKTEPQYTYELGSWDEIKECLIEEPIDNEVESPFMATPLQAVRPDDHSQNVPNVQPPASEDRPEHPDSEEDKIDAMKGLSDMDEEESVDSGVGGQRIGESSNLKASKDDGTFVLQNIDINPEMIKKLMEEKKIEAEKYRKYLLSRNLISTESLYLYDYDKLKTMYLNEKEKMKRRSKEINIEELRKRYDGLCGYLLDSGMNPEIVERLSRKEVLIQADNLKKKEETRKERKKISRRIDEEMEEREKNRK